MSGISVYLCYESGAILPVLWSCRSRSGEGQSEAALHAADSDCWLNLRCLGMLRGHLGVLGITLSSDREPVVFDFSMIDTVMSARQVKRSGKVSTYECTCLQAQ